MRKKIDTYMGGVVSRMARFIILFPCKLYCFLKYSRAGGKIKTGVGESRYLILYLVLWGNGTSERKIKAEYHKY